MKLSNLERETLICFNESESAAEVFTFNGAMRRKLEQLAADRPEDVQHVKTTPEGGETYTLPKGWLKIRAPRILSEEQRNAMRERGRQAYKSNLSAANR